MQDTVKQKVFFSTDTLKYSTDSVPAKLKASYDSLPVHNENALIKKAENIVADTTSVCRRNPIADITFYDSTNIVTRINDAVVDRFPFVFTEMNNNRREETRAALITHLKEGYEIPGGQYRLDWIVPVILVSAFIYALVRTRSGNIFHGLSRFISFRGINESGSRDTGSLFQWQSTLTNLASFINLSVFAFLTTIRYNLQFPGIPRFIICLICFAIIIISLTIRHFLCLVTGKASGEEEVFREYLVAIYQAYRMAGIFIFFIIILILYTDFAPVKVYFSLGFYAIGILYLARVLRLFLIFINRHVSIFYLILYLCALEILPVVILVRYITGLV